MDLDSRWIYAGSAVVAGFVIGALLATVARRVLADGHRRPAVRAVAGPTGTFLFWFCAVTGLVTALGFTSPETLRPIPSDVLAWIPRALAAGLVLLAGYAVGGAVGTGVAAAAQRAIGHRPAALERALRWGVVAIAVVLALSNLGVETTLLQIAVAGMVFSVGLAAALIAGVGSRSVAASIAAGRALREELTVGAEVTLPGTTGDVLSGTITAVRPVVIHVEDGGGGTVVVPIARLLDGPFRIVGASERR